MKTLKEIQDKLDQIQSTIKEPKKAAKPEDWWKVEYIDRCKGYRGISILMALGTSGPFDSIEQWRNACRKEPPIEIPRATFYELRKELRGLGLLDDKMQTVTNKGTQTVEKMKEFPFAITTKKQLTDIIESL
jgi:hypothetical protein